MNNTHSMKTAIHDTLTLPMDIVREATDLLVHLETMPSLAPCHETNGLFNRLVGLSAVRVSDADAQLVCTHLDEQRALARLRTVCAAGEYALEIYWADKLARADDVEAVLAGFPYLDEYRALTAKEVSYLPEEATRVLFVGSGPLPLSAYFMVRDHGLDVDILDYDHAAHTCAMQWLRRLPESENMRCVHKDIHDIHDMRRYDAVILAALVGLGHDDKKAVLTHLRTTMVDQQLLLVRSAHNLRKMLYQDTPVDMLDGFDVCAVWHPECDFVNSIVVCARS